MAYFANPITLYGVTCLVLAALFLLVGRFSRPLYRDAMSLLQRVALTVSAVMILLGLVMGMTHRPFHAQCLAKLAAHEDTKGCGDMFRIYGH